MSLTSPAGKVKEVAIKKRRHKIFSLKLLVLVVPRLRYRSVLDPTLYCFVRSTKYESRSIALVKYEYEEVAARPRWITGGPISASLLFGIVRASHCRRPASSGRTLSVRR